MKSATERMDIISAYREAGTFRGAAIRHDAVWLLAGRDGHVITDALAACLNDGEETVREAAAALPRHRGPEGIFPRHIRPCGATSTRECSRAGTLAGATRSRSAPPGQGRRISSASRRTKPALSAFAITFEGRIVPSTTKAVPVTPLIGYSMTPPAPDTARTRRSRWSGRAGRAPRVRREVVDLLQQGGPLLLYPSQAMPAVEKGTEIDLAGTGDAGADVSVNVALSVPAGRLGGLGRGLKS